MPSQPSTASDDLIGQVIAGRYEVFAKLGQGGMGVVYAARQSPLGRTVAIKVLLRDMTSDPVAASRFEKEALAISRLSHPNIVTIFDFGSTDAGHKFIAMEFLDGRSLRDIIGREAPLSPKRTVRLMMYIARALADAHRQGIIHRDLKPDNIMVLATTGEQDFVKVLDFGVAKLKTREGETAHTLTSQDVILGTPKYMSPEQINGITDDPRSDLYALGAMAFEMLTGKVPFDADGAVKILMKHLQDEPPALHDVFPACRASQILEDLVMGLLHKDVRRRPQSARLLLENLEDLPEYTGPRSKLMTVAAIPVVKDPPLPVSDDTPLTQAADVPVMEAAAPVVTTSQQVTRLAGAVTGGANVTRGSQPVPTLVSEAPRFTGTQPVATAASGDEEDGVFTHTRLPPEAQAVLDKHRSGVRPAPAAPASLAAALPQVNPNAPTPAMDMEAAHPEMLLPPSPHLPGEAPRLEEKSTFLVHPRKRASPMLVGGAAVLLLGLVGVGAMAKRAASPAVVAPLPEPVAQDKPAVPVEKVPAPVPAEPPAEKEPVVVAAQEAPPEPVVNRKEDARKRPATVNVTVISIPAGAQVLDGQETRGVTPVVLVLPKAGATHVLTLRMEGFKDETRPVKADRARTVTVKMFKETRPSPTPVKVEPARAPQPVKTEPARAEPVKTETVKAAPVKQEPARAKDPPRFEKWDDLKDPSFNTP